MSKRIKHVAEARRIGRDSYDLINFEQLPRTASRERQIEALRKDQKWQVDHHNEISRSIDALIDSIEG